MISSRAPGATRAIAALSVCLLASCARPRGCQPEPASPEDAPDEQAQRGPLHAGHERWISRSAELVVFATRLEQLTEGMRRLEHAYGLAPSSPMALCARWSEAMGIDACTARGWEALGVSASEPAALVWERGSWGLIVGLASPGALAQRLAPEREGAGPEALVLEPGPDDQVPAKLRRGGRTLALVDVHEQVALLVPAGPMAPPGGHEAAGALKRWRELPAERRWSADPEHRLLRERLAPVGPLYGTVRPERWLDELPADGPEAAEQRARLERQAGVLGFALQRFPTEHRVRAHVLWREARGEPTRVASLGRAHGELDANLGALIEPGVLGVVRISADPSRFFELIRSGLPPTRRQELDELLAQLERELALDVREAILENTRGHAVAVLYGLEPRELEAPRARQLAAITSLEATREAIYLPIEDRERLELFLDAVTQLSEGKLHRQRVDRTVQYAWMVEGVLEWALLLHDDFVIWVDSTSAFTHATAHVREPRPLRPAIQRAGIGRLLEEVDRSGMYLDVATLRGVLPEGSAWHPLLAPLERVVVTTSLIGERTSQLLLDVTWRPEPPAQ